MSYLSIFADVIEELSTWDILHDHEDICRGANNLIPATTVTKRLKSHELLTAEEQNWLKTAQMAGT